MKIPVEFAPKSWEMLPGFVVLEDSASEFDGETLDSLIITCKQNFTESK